MVPVGEVHLAPLASLDCCGTSLVGMPSRTPVPGSVTIFQPTFSCRRLAVSARTPRSCGLSTPVSLPPRLFWNSLIALTMRSLTSPVIAPLYWPTQARSDCSASRSACAIALAVSSGFCSAGRIGIVVTTFGFEPTVAGAVICACADAPIAKTVNKIINVAVSIDLMTNPNGNTGNTEAIIDVRPIKHICLVGTNRAGVQGTGPRNRLTMLSTTELERYARHIVLREVGGPGQTLLKEASVLVIGAGGLGAPVLMYLAAAGIGTLGVVDDDIVSLSNLQRQIIHTTPDIGRRKVDSAAQQVYALNPHVNFESHAVRLDPGNAMSLNGGYDLVLDGSDNFETRYLVSDACFLAGKPLITAALGVFDGSLTTIRAHERNAEGELNPTYRCLFPEPPPPGTVPACAEAGVMGALAGVLGSMMALEAIREIVGFGDSLVGRLLMVDARAMRFETLRYVRDPDNPLNGDNPTITDP